MFDKRCALCSTTNKKNGKLICDDCSFIKEFIIKYGRENMRTLITNFYNSHTPSPAMNNFINPYNYNNYSYSAPALHNEYEPSAPPMVACRVCRNTACSCRQRSSSFSHMPVKKD